MSRDLTAIASKISKLLPRLGSNHDGEVVATARAIERVLRGAGHDWHDLVPALLPPPVQPDAVDLWTDKSTVRWCFHRRNLLSPRDCRFIKDLTGWHKPLSSAQRKWLHDIVAKLERVEAA
jgi:hypothetical protein